MKNFALAMDGKFNDIFNENRQNLMFHHTESLIRERYNCIRDGNIDKLLILLDTPLNGDVGVLAKDNELRSKKNLLICAVAIYTRAAMEGGVPAEEAYTLSDSFIQMAEEVRTIAQYEDLRRNVTLSFANKVRFVARNKYSKLIYNCIFLITKYIYVNVSLLRLSEELKVSPPYLSALFKKEIGTTISDYIFIKKVEEAKFLLSYTDKSILEITTLLYFNDQSYFSKIFKRYVGTSPKKYRNEHYRNI